MREVVFLGFWVRGVKPEDIEGKEVWTLNDWYQFYPYLLNPSRVYQIHEGWNGKHVTENNRFFGDWRTRYEQSKAEIVTLSDLSFSKERRLNKTYLAEVFGAGFFGSTFSYMFADAIMECVDRIVMKGIRLIGPGEYERQVPTTLLNINATRSRGIEVVCEYEKKWIAKGAKPQEYNPVWVNWANLKDVEMMYGSRKNIDARAGFEQKMYGALT